MVNLYIAHYYEDIERDLKDLEMVLPYIHKLWGRNVNMETTIENKRVLFTYDGKSMHRKYV